MTGVQRLSEGFCGPGAAAPVFGERYFEVAIARKGKRCGPAAGLVSQAKRRPGTVSQNMGTDEANWAGNTEKSTKVQTPPLLFSLW